MLRNDVFRRLIFYVQYTHCSKEYMLLRYFYYKVEGYNLEAEDEQDMGLEVDDQTKHDENENGIYYMERP